MYLLIVSLFAFIEQMPTVAFEAPAVAGGQVVILRDRQQMKQKNAETVKHVVIPKSDDPK